jgi:hypothetical protein
MIECVMFVNSYVCGASGGAEEKRYAYLRRMLSVGIRISVQVCQSTIWGGLRTIHVALFLSASRGKDGVRIRIRLMMFRNPIQ